MQVDDGELLVLGGDAAARRPPGLGARQVGADDAGQRTQRRAEPPGERVDRARAGDRPGPVLAGVLVGEPVDDQVDQVLVGGHDDPVDLHRAVAAVRLGILPQPGRDLVDDHRVLLPVVFGVGEHVGQQLARAELADGPPECLDAAGAAGDVGPPGGVVGDRRRPEASGRERLGGQAEGGVLGPEVVVELDVRLVEEQQVLALDAEHQGLRVHGPLAQRTGAEDGVQQEQREAGLRRHAGDAADRHVRPAGTVEELHVDVDRRAVPAPPDRDLVGHLVEVQGLGPLRAGRPADHLPRARRHVDLRFHPRGGDLGDLLGPRGQHAF